MRGSSLLPKQFRSLGNSDSWLNRNVSSTLLSISGIACQHPIHTIVVIALLASTSYVGLLQESLFDTTGHLSHGRGYVDLDALLVGSRTLELSKQTSWKWQVQENIALRPKEKVDALHESGLNIADFYRALSILLSLPSRSPTPLPLSLPHCQAPSRYPATLQL
jgi:hydroxymethylglutaryl-CoA reductase (NADPH)